MVFLEVFFFWGWWGMGGGFGEWLGGGWGLGGGWILGEGFGVVGYRNGNKKDCIKTLCPSG